MDDEEPPSQNFLAPVEQVAGRDIINNSVPPAELRLEGLKWMKKKHPFGTAMNSHRLLILLFIDAVLMVVHSSFTCNVCPENLRHKVDSVLWLFQVLIILVGWLVAQVFIRGCFYWGEAPTSGLFKDENGIIFWGELGGEDIRCPKCTAKLALSRQDNSDFLRCIRHRPHCSSFDPTEVQG